MSGPSVPLQRGDEVPTTVLSMVVEGLRELKGSVDLLSRDVNAKMDRLPEIYVPRREIERRWDENSVDIGEIRGAISTEQVAREKDIERLEKALKSAEEARQADRRWAIGVVLTATPIVLTVYTMITNAIGG